MMDALAQPRSDGLLTDQQLCNSISYVVAGKSVSASCFTNSVSRLHPKEWASGTAAGVAAAVMSALDLSSEQNNGRECVRIAGSSSLTRSSASVQSHTVNTLLKIEYLHESTQWRRRSCALPLLFNLWGGRMQEESTLHACRLESKELDFLNDCASSEQLCHSILNQLIASGLALVMPGLGERY